MTQEQKLQMYASYLPYGLDVSVKEERGSYVLIGVNYKGLITAGKPRRYSSTFPVENILPHLRPMSDLTKEIVHEGYNDGKPFYPMLEIPNYCENEDDFQDIEQEYHDTNNMPYWMIQLLLKWHFNIFGLDESEYIVKE